MAQYDFSTLNSSDLEMLVCDLLNAELPLDAESQYKTYKDGKDKGIDILYSTEKSSYERVGQVKHYYRTGYNGLLAKLKDNELKKIKRLNPVKYILATSVDLSVGNEDEIFQTLSPFIKSRNDIYGNKPIECSYRKTR